ncbi:MAG: hypothetical protein QM530_06845 [Phycisphaerales bacterium]|nr:hypothetical protein [Phycisphaerales bacterium]
MGTCALDEKRKRRHPSFFGGRRPPVWAAYRQLPHYAYADLILPYKTETYATDGNTYLDERTVSPILERRYYEMTNHLGNVQATLLEYRTSPVGAGAFVPLSAVTYGATLHILSEYTPRDVLVTICDEKDNYRFGFNGQEKVNEVNGIGNHNTAEHWEYSPRIAQRWNPDQKPQIGVSDYSVFNGNPIFFNDKEGDIVKVSVGNKAVGYTMINLYSGPEIASRQYKQKQARVPVYKVTVTNESGKTSEFLFTRHNLRANVNNKEAIEDRTFDVNTSGDSYAGMVRSRWKGKNNVLEIETKGEKFPKSQWVSGMKGDAPSTPRQAIQFHILGASDGCLLSVGQDNLLKGSAATSQSKTSGQAQNSFMKTIQGYQAEDKKNGYSNDIDVSFYRLHDNPDYKSDISGGTAKDNSSSSNSSPSKPPPIDNSLQGAP